MPKYAPAVDGKKPYVVTGSSWGKLREMVVFAADASDAKYKAGYRGTGEYVRSVRRATPEDIEGKR